RPARAERSRARGRRRWTPERTRWQAPRTPSPPARPTDGRETSARSRRPQRCRTAAPRHTPRPSAREPSSSTTAQQRLEAYTLDHDAFLVVPRHHDDAELAQAMPHDLPFQPPDPDAEVAVHPRARLDAQDVDHQHRMPALAQIADRLEYPRFQQRGEAEHQRAGGQRGSRHPSEVGLDETVVDP